MPPDNCFDTFLKKIKVKHIILGLFVTFFIWMINDYFNDYYIEEAANKNFRNKDKINLNELFHIGNCLLIEAGKKIVKIRHQQNLDIGQRKQKDNSIVTIADIESHNILVHTLKFKYKNLSLKSEENESKNFSNEFIDTSSLLEKCDNYQYSHTDKWDLIENVNVYIDPLDATQEYSENLVDYVTVMFCITVNGVPKAGSIHKPFNSSTISSFFEKKHLRRSSSDKSKTRIIISRSHTGSVKETIDQYLKDVEVIIAGGAGYKTTSLIRNQADLYLHTSRIYKWDICAPNAILNNLGGRLTKLNGDNIDFSTRKKKGDFDKNFNEDDDAVNGGIIATLYNYDYFFNIFKNKT